MPCVIEVLFTPAEFRALAQRDLSNTHCVVFDVLRATSTIVTALANGARAIIPVGEIAGAADYRKSNPDYLLAGERDGLRIGAALTGGIEFDLGNSPREFTAEKVTGKTIVTTTTNGTRALRACARAKAVLASSFLNLTATAEFLRQQSPSHVLVVCAGTGEDTALEDVLAAGNLCDTFTQKLPACLLEDSAQIALSAFENVKADLRKAVHQSKNARRLREIAELREDVEFCLQRDSSPICAGLDSNGKIRKIS